MGPFDESATAGMDFKVLKPSLIVFQVVQFCCLVSTVRAAASLQQPNQELCQSSGQHGRRGESFVYTILSLLLQNSI